MRAIVRVLDSISEHTGKIVLWAAVALVVVLCYEVTMRYVFNSPTNWVMETSMMLGGTIAAMGWGYTHRHQGHVRVDVFYMHLSPRGKAIVDVACSIIFLFPLLAILIYASASWAHFSWEMGEKMVGSSWKPPAGPIRSIVPLGFCLFTLQCVSQFIRDLYLLVRNKTL